MELKEKMKLVVDLMHSTKESWVESKPDVTDLAIYLHFFRGDDMVATVQTVLDRDVGLDAGRLGAMGFNADTISITFESYFSHLKESPLTGEKWMHKEMQYVAETVPDAAEKGWVSECLTTCMHERGGGYGMGSAGYLIKDDKVQWLDEKYETITADDTDASGGGLMFDVLQDAMQQPTILQSIEAKAKSGDSTANLMLTLVEDREAQLFHMDMAVFKALTEKDLATSVILHADSDTLRAAMIRERVGPPS